LASKWRLAVVNEGITILFAGGRVYYPYLAARTPLQPPRIVAAATSPSEPGQYSYWLLDVLDPDHGYVPVADLGHPFFSEWMDLVANWHLPPDH
jgi:hypothetical protein